jgi:LysM repeat protein
VRISILLSLFFLALAWPGRGQVPDPGTIAQDPAMQQDALAAREKLLKAADQLDMIQSNSEANKLAIESMKADIARLQSDNADLKQQLSALQATLDKAEADHVKERQALVNEVSSLLASKTSSGTHSAAKHHELAEDSPDQAASVSTEVHAGSDPAPDNAAPTPSHPPATTNDSTDTAATSSPPDAAPAPKIQKGYYHVVESGETLSMICSAYRDQGVKVSISQVRKANGLTSKSILKVGQKLFIPKPGD